MTPFLRLIPYTAGPSPTRQRGQRGQAADAHTSVQDWLANHDDITYPPSATASVPEENMGSPYAGPQGPAPTPARSLTNLPLSRAASERGSSTAIPSMPDYQAALAKLPLPTAITHLENAIKSTRDAEALHAYDIGVCAALKSMELHWSSLCAQRHVSNNEKRIFRREAQRLQELVRDAERETMGNEERLARRQGREQMAWGVLRVSGKGEGEADDEDVTRLTESISQLSLGEPLDIFGTKELVRVRVDERISESDDDESEETPGLTMRVAHACSVFGGEK
ncbi:hypothetical protein B0T16DRAFT_392599 [Cercophora newfieldiana]|uniref:Uncharacterized protein n=1 Tax=Cercophora newfieldiana TaxID=92897 RepID=A0AA40CMP9_9PEZI|nr:hypothetical protein B0T16DRAFT_392599 [Cercophora newfieldiana]